MKEAKLFEIDLNNYPKLTPDSNSFGIELRVALLCDFVMFFIGIRTQVLLGFELEFCWYFKSNI